MLKETLEEAAESRYGTDMDSIRGSNVYDLNTDLKRGFIEGAKWMQERMYSEEDLLSAFEAGMMFIGEDKGSFKEWFEQYKKGGQDE
jgi:hypothetical protein